MLPRALLGVVVATASIVVGMALPAVAAGTGSISGTVTAPGSPQGICVSAFVPGSDPAQLVTSVAAASDGTYTLTGIPAGTVDVEFSGTRECPGFVHANVVTQWYANEPTQSAADAVTVSAGTTTTGIDATMLAGGTISGTVTAASNGAGISGICVGAYVRGADPQLVTATSTIAGGSYTLDGVPDGSFDVHFFATGLCPGGTPSNFVAQWYSGAIDETSATSVAVTSGATVPNIDAAMDTGGTITGTVTASAGGAPLAGICVAALIPGVDEQLVSSVGTAADGTYTLIGVPTGDLHVEFFATGFCPGGTPQAYVTQWYNGKATAAAADLVAVTEGATTSGIDAHMATGGSISGTVTASGGGAPLAGICVAVYAPFQSGVAPQLISSTSTAADGTYTLTGAPVGGVDVKFFSTGFCPGGVAANYAMQWYSGKLTQGTADPVSVSAGTTTTGIDAALDAGGTITGTITAASGGAPLFGVCIAAFGTGANAVVLSSTGTASDGTYSLIGVPAGSVRLRFNTQGFCPGGVPSNYLTQWYAAEPSYSAADTLTISTGTTTSGIDASMGTFSIAVDGGGSDTVAFGNTATLSVAGIPAGVTGSVVFGSPGHANLCTITLPATSCHTSATLTAGSYSPITAQITNADSQFGGASANSVALTIGPAPTSFSITVDSGSSSTIVQGAQATLAETGLPTGAAGTVVFGSPGHANLCTITRPATSCLTSSSLPAGSYAPISATFTDTDGNYASSTSSNTVSLTVSAASVAPGPPRSVAASAGNGHAVVTWIVPLSNGGSAITDYVVTPYAGAVALAPRDTSSTGTSFDVTGLTNGVTYTFSVHAVNGIGAGTESARSNSVRPSTVPGAPRAVHATVSGTPVTVTWSPPTSNGGAPITSYTVVASPGGAKKTVAASALQVSFASLPAGTYTFTVRATNVRGAGPSSSPSNAVATPRYTYTAHFTDGQYAFLLKTAAHFGIAANDVPAKGVAVLAYILAITHASGTKPIGSVPNSGPHAISATYNATDNTNIVMPVAHYYVLTGNDTEYVGGVFLMWLAARAGVT